MHILIGECPDGHVIVAIEEIGQEFHLEVHQAEGVITAIQQILKNIEKAGTAKYTDVKH